MSRRHNFSGDQYGYPGNVYPGKQPVKSQTQQRNPAYVQNPHQSYDSRVKQPVGTPSRPRDFDNDRYPQQVNRYPEEKITKGNDQLIADYEDIVRQLQSENKRMKDQLDEERRMKQDALSRLSQVAGNKLKDRNPGIADLGDANRPSKLGEKMSSLYTEEWMDAFEEIKLKNAFRKKDDSEGEICKLLLKIFVFSCPALLTFLKLAENNQQEVITCFKTCKEISVKQLSQMNTMAWNLVVVLHLDEVEGNPDGSDIKAGSVLVSPNRESLPSFNSPVSGTHSFTSKPQNNLSQTIKGGNTNMIPYDHNIYEDIIQQGKDKRKQNIPYVIDKIKRKCLDKIKTTVISDIGKDLQIYIHKCAEISWLMNVQDPPMGIIDHQVPGSPISKERRQYFTMYSKSSDVVDYVIWPVVLLHEDGPFISKGVIQGKK